MRKLANLLVALALVAAVAAPGVAIPFLGPNTQTFEGIVNYIQPTNFLVMSSNDKMTRILIPKGKKLPPQVQIGVRVKVVAVQSDNGQWVLDHFEEIQLSPTPSGH